MTRAAFSLAVRPITRPPVSASRPRERGHDVGLAGAGRGDQAADEPCGRQQAHAGLPLGMIQVGAGQRRGRGLRRDPLRDRQPGYVHQVLLMVEVLSRCTNFASPGGR